MQDWISLVHNPALWKLLLGYMVFMAATDALPPVDEKTGKLYKFFYAFVHGLSINLRTAAKALKVPGSE